MAPPRPEVAGKSACADGPAAGGCGLGWRHCEFEGTGQYPEPSDGVVSDSVFLRTGTATARVTPDFQLTKQECACTQSTAMTTSCCGNWTPSIGCCLQTQATSVLRMVSKSTSGSWGGWSWEDALAESGRTRTATFTHSDSASTTTTAGAAGLGASTVVNSAVASSSAGASGAAASSLMSISTTSTSGAASSGDGMSSAAAGSAGGAPASDTMLVLLREIGQNGRLRIYLDLVLDLDLDRRVRSFSDSPRRWRPTIHSMRPRATGLGAWAALPRGILGSVAGRTAILPASVCSETHTQVRTGLGLAELQGAGFKHRLRGGKNRTGRAADARTVVCRLAVAQDRQALSTTEGRAREVAGGIVFNGASGDALPLTNPGYLRVLDGGWPSGSLDLTGLRFRVAA